LFTLSIILNLFIPKAENISRFPVHQITRLGTISQLSQYNIKNTIWRCFTCGIIGIGAEVTAALIAIDAFTCPGSIRASAILFASIIGSEKPLGAIKSLPGNNPGRLIVNALNSCYKVLTLL
jgi:hypothetical protein